MQWYFCCRALGKTRTGRPSSKIFSPPVNRSPSWADWPSMRRRPCLIQRSISRREPTPAFARTFWIRSATRMSFGTAGPDYRPASVAMLFSAALGRTSAPRSHHPVRLLSVAGASPALRALRRPTVQSPDRQQDRSGRWVPETPVLHRDRQDP